MLLHALAIGWLLDSRPEAAKPEVTVMVVDFIPTVRRRPAINRAEVPAVAKPERAGRRAAAAPVVDPAPAMVPAPAAAAPTSPGMAAVFVGQSPDWTPRPPGSTSSDPFASRTPPLPGKHANTFRMREPPSPARMVARIGVVFGADGRTGCSDIGDEIASYTQAGDRAALDRAIEYERRHCRP